MKTILVAGGAGYIGSHMVYQLIKEGYDVVTIDNLSTGFRRAVHPKSRFYQGDTRNKNFLDEVFQKENIDAVIHMDAFSIVPESMANPLKYIDNNLIGLIYLLETMKKYHVNKMIFSTTAAVYGNPNQVPIKESDEKSPINTYGDTKLMMEKIMHWVDQADNIKYVALRYFNAAGALSSGELGEAHVNETHLIPNILGTVTGRLKEFTIFGNDYDTPDGTNIRDYVHVLDLADAHILALKYLDEGKESNQFNLGSNNGYSVKEIFEEAKKVTGIEIPMKIAKRRPGDPDVLIANSDKAREILNWHPQFENVHDIIQTAWNWHKSHPRGYEK